MNLRDKLSFEYANIFSKYTCKIVVFHAAAVFCVIITNDTLTNVK